jgi:tetratricopeptide (TPR) repeat protein
MRLNPSDARAPYYLGNFWYAHRRHREAVDCWELARGLDPSFPTVHRNLGLAYFNRFNDPALALESYEKAFSLDPSDARVFYELDQLTKRLNRPLEERLARLQAHPGLVEQRDDLSTEQVTLLNLLGRPDEAHRLTMRRNFHPWEGGEGKITAQYVLSLVEMARLHLQAGEPARAVEELRQAQVYPPNLGEGKLAGAEENAIFYYLGLAHQALGDPDTARAWLERASVGLSEPTSAMFYNDQPPETIFYQGLALQALGREAEARQRFRKMIAYGRDHLDDAVQIDYFAVSLPDFLVFEEDLQRRNRVHCRTMQALGHLGLGEREQALEHFDLALELDASHAPAVVHRRLL